MQCLAQRVVTCARNLPLNIHNERISDYNRHITVDNISIIQDGRQVTMRPTALHTMIQPAVIRVFNSSSRNTESPNVMLLSFYVDNYDRIRQSAKVYSETGNSSSPVTSRGRGKRVSKKNKRYISSSDKEADDDGDDDVDQAQVIWLYLRVMLR